MNITQAKNRYDIVCCKLEALHEEAFELEKYILFLRSKEAKKGD